MVQHSTYCKLSVSKNFEKEASGKDSDMLTIQFGQFKN
jgi:hypothetical protein